MQVKRWKHTLTYSRLFFFKLKTRIKLEKKNDTGGFLEWAAIAYLKDFQVSEVFLPRNTAMSRCEFIKPENIFVS